MKFSKNRTTITATCPCGRSNKDGKFAPVEGDPRSGYCHSCGEFFKSKDFKDQDINYDPLSEKIIEPTLTPTFEHFFQSISIETPIHKLIKNFFPETYQETLNTYMIGGAPLDPDIAIFWSYLPDMTLPIQGKVMKYNVNGKRDKDFLPYYFCQKKYGGVQSLFGLHLLKRKPKKVYVVESEKTALLLYAKTQIPTIATGGSTALSWEKIRYLNKYHSKDIQYTIIPDFDLAGKNSVPIMLKRLQPVTNNITVCETQERTELISDIGDLLIYELCKTPQQQTHYLSSQPSI